MTMFRGTPPSEYQVAIFGPDHVDSPGYAFRAARVLPVEGEPIENGVVLTRDGRIVAVGPAASTAIPAGFEPVDLGDAWCVPGLIDLHCHIASASSDINDSVFQANPEMRTLDLVTMDHEKLRNALAGGVTTVMYIPGSGANVGGFGTLTKTWGRNPGEALIRFPGCVKIAQGNNPTRRSGDLGATHLGMNENLRRALQRGRRYHEEWVRFERGEGPRPEHRPDLEYLRGLFRYEYPVCAHSQYFQVSGVTLRMLRDEFDLWLVIVHGTFDAFRLAEEALERGVPVCTGPREYWVDPGDGRFWGIAESWYAGGLLGWDTPVRGLGVDGIGINTDSPVVAQEQLTLQAAMAVRLGLPDGVALRALTINPARFVAVEHRIGSLEIGKDADLAFFSGDPLDPRSHVAMTVVNGHIAYRRDPRRPRF
ncbi:MAG: amidohydrolase family protein [Planctomycetes bacterium]|nr:amidohydrolase family protein [Planctomycetota bacterium]